MAIICRPAYHTKDWLIKLWELPEPISTNITLSFTSSLILIESPFLAPEIAFKESYPISSVRASSMAS
jgi:hypothetical protein